MSYSFTISGFSDEIDSNVVKQFEHLNKLGISYFEPRGIDGKNIADLDDGEVLALKEKMDQYGIKVSSIGSPIGKISINDPMEPHMEKLARVIKTAKMLDTKYIRVFSFFIPEGEDPANYKEEVLSRMKQMVALAEKEGVVLLHENEKGIYGDIAPRCKDIFGAVKSAALGCVFDPANFVQCGQTVYPDGFQLLKPYLTYMHIKDAKQDGTVVPSGFGEGGLKKIISELKKMDYQGFLSLEPHLGSFEGLAALELSDEMLKLEESGPDKFTMAYEALKNIIDEKQ